MLTTRVLRHSVPAGALGSKAAWRSHTLIFLWQKKNTACCYPCCQLCTTGNHEWVYRLWQWCDWDMKHFEFQKGTGINFLCSAGITCSERTFHINWRLLENIWCLKNSCTSDSTYKLCSKAFFIIITMWKNHILECWSKFSLSQKCAIHFSDKE